MNYYNEIKNELINNEINRKVKSYSINKSDLNTYYNVGKLLLDAGKNYGEGIIKEYSLKLTEDLNIKYDVSSLNKMRKFYILIKKLATVSPNLSYSHYVELLPYDDLNKIRYYIKIISEQNLSVRQLRERLKSDEYERLPESTKNKIINQDKSNMVDFVKNPIIIKKNSKYDIFSEKVLQKLILEDIENFLDELGNGFTFIKSEYPIKIGDRYNYIDLLLYNIKYNRLPAIIVTRFIEHAESLYKYYTNHPELKDYNIRVIDHTSKNRESIINQFAQGKIDVLITTYIIKRGINLPLAVYLQNAAGSDSEEDISQICGRMERTFKGKKKSYLDDMYYYGQYLERHSKHRINYYIRTGMKVINLKKKRNGKL